MISMVDARDTVSAEMRRLKKCGFSVRRKTAITLANRTAIVVVFIPPAVEPGEPPINIKIVIIDCPVSLMEVRSAVLNPAVLGVTAWKKDSSTLSPTGASAIQKRKSTESGGKSKFPSPTKLLWSAYGISEYENGYTGCLPR